MQNEFLYLPPLAHSIPTPNFHQNTAQNPVIWLKLGMGDGVSWGMRFKIHSIAQNKLSEN